MSRNFRKLTGIGAMVCICIVIFSAFFPAEAAQEKKLVYVVGNPDLYPIEYYDKGERVYKGLIPELLKEFSAKGEYQVEYIHGGKKDIRYSKLENQQAELISGCVSTDKFPKALWDSGVIVFETERSKSWTACRVLVTDIADKKLRSDLEMFFSEVTEEKINGILMNIAEEDDEVSMWLLLGTAVAALVLAFALVRLIRKKRRELRQMRIALETDEATGAGNYNYLKRCWRVLVNDRNRVLYSMIYFYIDIEQALNLRDYKDLNRFLKEAADIFRERMYEKDICARVSGRGFVLLLQPANEEQEQELIQSKLQKIRGCAQSYSKSFGVSVFAGVHHVGKTDKNLDDCIFKAQQSSSYAYNHRMDLVKYTAEAGRQAEEESKLQNDALTALENGEFQVYFHLFVQLDNHKIVGAEALSRWIHPEKGMLMPEQYRSATEAEKVVSHLDYYILDKVCRFLQNSFKKASGDFFVSCNFSRNTFAAPDFVQRCKAIMEKYEFPYETLILELTEKEIAYDEENIYRNISQMRDCGVSITLNDFGEGYSSFADLQTSQFNGVKLDRKLIENLNGQQGEIILQGIIETGHRLGMTVIAEGAEYPEQIEKLKALQCDVAEGYFYKPLPMREAIKIYLEQSRAH